GDGWEMEVKFDGIRAIGIKDGKNALLFSRRPRELTRDFPKIAAVLALLPKKSFVVDGEIVAFDSDGRTSFQLLQNRKNAKNSAPSFFILFDLLQLEEMNLFSKPLIQRRAELQKLLQNAREPLRFSESLNAPPERVWNEIKKLGLEGIIAKRVDSNYEPGRRSGAWIKIKSLNEQEFVIGGYTQPRGSRKHFGAILVGYYSGKNLLFAAGVGTGFDARMLETLFKRFQKLRTPNCPFANLPSRNARGETEFSVAEMKRCVWLKPKLVCQVKFFDWTRGNNLRQPVFLGLREDKKAEDVIREIPK
ncbi:MAG: non-homologous end-joining DNA ligase, partial [Limisphaerales bacterium]